MCVGQQELIRFKLLGTVALYWRMHVTRDACMTHQDITYFVYHFFVFKAVTKTKRFQLYCTYRVLLKCCYNFVLNYYQPVLYLSKQAVCFQRLFGRCLLFIRRRQFIIDQNNLTAVRTVELFSHIGLNISFLNVVFRIFTLYQPSPRLTQLIIFTAKQSI